MRRRSPVPAWIVAALSCALIVGCASDRDPGPAAAVKTTAAAAPSPAARVLPPPEMLTDVLYRLADPKIPGEQKVALVDDAGPEDAAPLAGFARALQDSGLTPLGFTAGGIAWSERVAGAVTADITAHSDNPALGGGFSLPMDFVADPAGWQLTRPTAEMLFTLGGAASTAPR